MYAWNELQDLSVKPRINDISLQTLQTYYDNTLYPFFFHYHIQETSAERKSIELRFNRENFCHLLGIEKIMRNSTSAANISNYKGLRGWENIKNGQYDIPDLRRANRRRFASAKAKYVYFYLIPKLIQDPRAVLFENTRAEGNVSIESEILFYSNVENDRAIIHLGIDKTDNEYYIPRTFFVEKVDSFENDGYIRNQAPISVTVEDRTITL